MKLYKTLIMLCVFVIMLFLADYALKKKENKDAKEEAAKKMYDVKTDEIVELAIKNKNGDLAFKKSDDGNWTIVKPFNMDASKSNIDGVLSNIKDIDIKKTIGEKVTDSSKYGITDKSDSFSFKLKGSDVLKTVLIGSKNPDDSGLYVKEKDSEKVLMVSPAINGVTEKTLADFRERQILRFEKEDVKKVSLTNENGTFEFTKDKDAYALLKPIKAPAGDDGTEKIINTLSNARVKDFADEDFKNPEKFGLNKPAIKVVLTLKDDKTVSVMLSKVGKTPNEKYYLKLVSKENVFEMSPYTYKDLNATIEDLLDRNIADFNTDKVEKINLIADGKSYSFKKEGEDKWSVGAPFKFDVAGMSLSQLMSKAKGIKIEKFVGQGIKGKTLYGFDKPYYKFEAEQKEEGKENKISGFIIGKKKDKDLYFINRLGSDLVFTAKADLIEKLPAKKDDFREKHLVLFAREDISEIILADDRETVKLTVGDKDWTKEHKGYKDKATDEAQSLISDLRVIKAEDIIDSPLADKEYGFDKIGLKISVKTKRNEVVSLDFGEKKVDTIYARKNGQKVVYRLKYDAFKKIGDKFKKLVSPKK